MSPLRLGNRVAALEHRLAPASRVADDAHAFTLAVLRVAEQVDADRPDPARSSLATRLAWAIRFGSPSDIAGSLAQCEALAA